MSLDARPQQRPPTLRRRQASAQARPVSPDGSEAVPGLPLAWRAPEFERAPLGRGFYAVSGLALLGIIAYALVSDSPVMAITFILIGVVGYMALEKEPRTIGFSIAEEGVVADRELYAWENLRSFDVVEEDGKAFLSLETKGQLLARVSVPLGNTDPALVQEILLGFLPEKPYEPSLVDIIGRMLHI
jgi:hypothetical protein